MSDEQKKLNEGQSPVMMETDWYLQTLVELVNRTDGEFPITLYVGGVVVSGYLTGGLKYFSGLQKQLKEFFGNGDNIEETTALMVAHAKEVYSLENTTDQPPLAQYIHLRSARVFAPGQVPMPREGCWWRGKLASVSGFSFGALGMQQE